MERRIEKKADSGCVRDLWARSTMDHWSNPLSSTEQRFYLCEQYGKSKGIRMFESSKTGSPVPISIKTKKILTQVAHLIKLQKLLQKFTCNEAIEILYSAAFHFAD